MIEVDDFYHWGNHKSLSELYDKKIFFYDFLFLLKN